MERLEELEKEVRAVKAAIASLQQEVRLLREELQDRLHPVEAILWQRGLPILAHGDQSQVLLPANASFSDRARFYRLMRRYSFRLFLRDLIQSPEGAGAEGLSRYCSLHTARSYLKALCELGVVESSPGNGYRLLSRRIVSFGPTLEWYVREVFQREFLAPALFNVRLRHTRYGGDYDVISLLADHLIYVEVKSSPPRGVEVEAVSAFLKRLRDLEPHLAVFLVDTELRMKDKIVPLFMDAMAQQYPQGTFPGVARLVNEIFHISHSIYLINSRKGIYSNLRLCFRDFVHAQESFKLCPEAFPADEP